MTSLPSVALVPTSPKYTETPGAICEPRTPASLARSSSSENATGSTAFTTILPPDMAENSSSTSRTRWA